jgi:murein DD-endopeptidase MepM/ murein hydrolase activator NlpD
MEKLVFKLNLRWVFITAVCLVSSACVHRGLSSTAEGSSAPASDLQVLSEGAFEVRASSAQSVPGGVIGVEIRAKTKIAIDSVKGRFLDKEIPFYRVAGGEGEGQFAALIGIPYEQKTGKIHFEFEVNAPTVSQKFKLPIEIVEAKYLVEHLKVNPRKVHPKKKDLVRIEKEVKEVGALYREQLPEKLWHGAFQYPISSIVTSPYGIRRIFNGALQSFHNGLDLRAPEGTVISAPADGKVVMAKDLFFTGNTVILSHGFGLYTIYAHMSRLEVTVGQKVKTGDHLGLSGATGRASGPHLHWGVVLHGTKVDPLQLMKVAL